MGCLYVLTVGGVGVQGLLESSRKRLIWALFVFAACAVGPDFTRPEADVREAWREQGAGQLDTKGAVDPMWWKSFNDPTLDRLIELAFHQNLDLQIAGLRIVEARAQLGIATGRLLPQTQQIFAQANAVGVSAATPNLPTGFNTHFGDFQLGFDAAWELDFWGKFRRGVEAENANLLATNADYANALVSLTAEVARTYVTIRTDEVLVKLTEENIKVQEGGLSIAQARHEHGATSELDVAQAATLLESTRSTLPQLTAALQQARNALSTLLGQPSGAVDALLGAPGDIPAPGAKVSIGVPAELLRRRPDIRSAELFAAAQCARIGVARADLFPSFSLAGTIGYRLSTPAVVSGNPLNDIFYAVGPAVNWPFLNYGRLTNQVRVQDARYQQLIVGYRSTVLKAAQEVEDSATGFVSQQAAQEAAQRSVTAALRAAEISVTMYREGATDYQRVLDAERSLLQEQTTLAQTRSQVTTNLIALYKALGGGWEVRQGEPIVPQPMQEEMHKRTSWGDMLTQPPLPDSKGNPPPAKR
jgi:NodT family efflux transporter outer membrane factor (OMF) lipoprotein